MKSRQTTTQNARKRAVIRRPMTKCADLRNSAPVRVVLSPKRSNDSNTKLRSISKSTISNHANDTNSNNNNNNNKSASQCVTQRSSAVSTAVVRNQTYINDTDLVSLREKLYENPTDFSDIENGQLQRLQAHLREYVQDCALTENYNDAEKASVLLENVKNEISKRPSLVTSRGLTSDDEEAQKIKEFEESWRIKFEEYDKETEQKTNELEERQKKAYEDFEKLWSTDKPQKYRKPSNQLLQLKKIERSLAISGQYERARAVHNEAEQLAAKEAQELQTVLIRDYRVAKELFVEKQQQEKQQFVDARQQVRTAKESAKNIEYNKFVNRETVVKEKNKEALRGSKERSGVIKPDYGASITNAVQNKSKYLENVIPPLFAPNDPTFVEEDERRAKEKRKKQLEFQKKNAEEALLEYTVQPSPRDDSASASEQKAPSEKSTPQKKSIQSSPEKQSPKEESPKSPKSPKSAKSSDSSDSDKKEEKVEQKEGEDEGEEQKNKEDVVVNSDNNETEPKEEESNKNENSEKKAENEQQGLNVQDLLSDN